jgi:cytokinin dehydrogenase
VNALLAANRQVFEACAAIDGSPIPSTPLPFHRHDWQKHYQPQWDDVVSTKPRFDSDNILTPGQGIFPS